MSPDSISCHEKIDINELVDQITERRKSQESGDINKNFD